MNKNYSYKLKATSYNPDIRLKDFEKYFNDIKKSFNSRKVTNQKEIVSIKISNIKGEGNVILIDLLTEKPLPSGRELLSVRRVSEALAGYDASIVVPKSHVLISV